MMRCLSLWQPHATLIGWLEKPYETRGFPVPYRGWMAIHASKTPKELDSLAQRLLLASWGRIKADSFLMAFAEALDAHNALDPMDGLDRHAFPLGAIVAIARLDAIYDAAALHPKLTGHAREFGDFGEGRYAWRLEEVQALELPLPYRGQQGLWTLPHDVERDLIKAPKVQMERIS